MYYTDLCIRFYIYIFVNIWRMLKMCNMLTLSFIQSSAPIYMGQFMDLVIAYFVSNIDIWVTNYWIIVIIGKLNLKKNIY